MTRNEACCDDRRLWRACNLPCVLPGACAGERQKAGRGGLRQKGALLRLQGMSGLEGLPRTAGEQKH